jgi:F-type H+-transporting ATPase subunit epsilon
MPLTLEIVTPEMRALTVQCDEVRLPGVEGGFGVRPGHTPFMTLLRPGELVVFVSGKDVHRFAVGEGFCEVSDDHVRVLAEEAFRADTLDPAAIEKELAERKARFDALKPGDATYDLERAQIERAAARLDVARRH